MGHIIIVWFLPPSECLLNRPLVVSPPTHTGTAESWGLIYCEVKHMIRTAILVDGGFYRKRAAHLWGHKTAEQRATELTAYCQAHLKDGKEERYLYRIDIVKIS